MHNLSLSTMREQRVSKVAALCVFLAVCVCVFALTLVLAASGVNSNQHPAGGCRAERTRLLDG